MIDDNNESTNKFLTKVHSSRLQQKERNLKNTIKPGQFVTKLVPPHDQKIVSKSRYLQDTSPHTYLVLDSACNTIRIRSMHNGSISTCGAHDVRPVYLNELQQHLPHKALSSLYQTTHFQPGNQPHYHPPFTPPPDRKLMDDILNVTNSTPQNNENVNKIHKPKKKVQFDNTVVQYSTKGRKMIKNYVNLNFQFISTPTKHHFLPYDFSCRELAIFSKKG